MMQTTYNVEQIVNHFHYIKPWISVPENDRENEQLIAFARDLKKEGKTGKNSAKDLLPLVLEHINEYEKRAYPLPKVKPNEALSFLMEQHQLTQHDLPEVGSQSLISKILRGERKLTVEHIEKLCERFNVSPVVFF
ncbi:MAG: helix-turn-helix domain-containing protein [Gammaproteobacteria bacterium]|nr:helix-turn-helix domain-containing protein [Gammaproteobacteria bacterium]MCD8542602.1 helix-turn-helix domain-containing protein [Gammaproteobacteria bacterium]